MSLIEQLPERRTYSLEELKERVRKGEQFIFAESFDYAHGRAPVVVETGVVTLAILEDLEAKISDPEISRNITRVDGKKLTDPITVFHFTTGKQKDDFFSAFISGVETLETVLPLARKYREGAIRNIREVSEKARDLVRKLNVEEETLSRKTVEHMKLEGILKSERLLKGLDENVIFPIRDNPVVFLYLASNPGRLEHNLKVNMWAVAIANRAGVALQDLRELSIASTLYDVADFWAEQRNIDKEGDAYRLRDFLVPKRMFFTRSNGDESLLDGMTMQEVEAITHHDSRRDGREVIIGDKTIVYLPENLSTAMDQDPRLWSKVLEYLKRKEKGQIVIETIGTTLYHPLFLAQRFVSYIERYNTILHIAKMYSVVKKEGRLSARADFVDAFLSLVEEKYLVKATP